MRTWRVFGVVICILASAHSFHRQRRHLVDLGTMIRTVTNRNPLDFVGYGNWCGLGGSGTPIDGIDRCCKAHDLCYDKARETVCLDQAPHVARYKWKYYAGKTVCEKADKDCGIQVCECDRRVTECIANHLDEYKQSNRRPKQLVTLLFGKSDQPTELS